MTTTGTALSASAGPEAMGPAIPAVTLFLVPPRVDRLALGRRLVGPLVSSRPQDQTLAQRGLHPDVMELLPPGGKEKIGIDQVREVIRMAQFSAVQADRKACLAPYAEDLTPEASNALLKILEEPTRGMVFALLAEHTGDLLPTIVSRSRIERVMPESRAALLERLCAAGYSTADADWLARVATRTSELADLTAAPLAVAPARTAAQERSASAGAADLVAACLDAGPIERREALLELAVRAAALDPEALTTAVATLAAQERATVFVFLSELLSACADAVRASFTDDSAPPMRQALSTVVLERGCTAIEAANRALVAYSPPEAVLLSLFLAFGGLPRAC